MPTYDFVCRSCDASFEIFSTGFLKDEQKQCPSCGSAEVEQKLTGFMCCTTSGKASTTGAAACPAGTGFR